ncbi:hypothetical protein HYU22_05785 [Candidatus Woesearchaeota archaeon]|nr:hypothetical protein [Candidatus Woesearchaeota archaeon]
MLGLKRKQPVAPETYPEPDDTLALGVYNRWKSAFIESSRTYSAMGHTIEYFVLSPIDESRTAVVRVVQDLNFTNDPSFPYRANYSEDLKIFPRPASQITALDVMNAYSLCEHEKKYADQRDHFGLRRVGTLEDFLAEIRHK